jgi:uncharacterized protein YycO
MDTIWGVPRKDIKIQFVCESAIASQTIAWFSQGHLSHVDAVLDNGDLVGARSDSVGGQLPGVRVRPPNYLEFSHRVVMAVPAKATENVAFYSFLRSQLGKPYDKKAILGFLLNRDWREPDSWICSELMSAAMEAADILPKGGLYLAANKITPVACALIASAVGGVVQDDASK